MKILLSLFLLLLIESARCTCQTSIYQASLGNSSEFSLENFSPSSHNMHPVDYLLYDIDGSYFEILTMTTPAKKTLIRRVGDDDSTAWTKVFDDVQAFPMSNVILSSTSYSDDTLLMMALHTNGYAVSIQINVATGQMKSYAYSSTSDQILINSGTENIQFGIDRYGSSGYYVAIDTADNNAMKLYRQILDASFSVQKCMIGLTKDNYMSLGLIGESFSDFFMVGINKETTDFNRILLHSVTWNSDGTPIQNWGRIITNGINTSSQTVRIADSRSSDILVMFAGSGNSIVLLVIAKSDGTAVSKHMINTSFANIPMIYSMKTCVGYRVLFSVREGEAGESYLIAWDLSTNTGATYKRPATAPPSMYFSGLGYSTSRVMVGGEVPSDSKYFNMKFDYETPFYLGSLLTPTTAFTFTTPADGAYDLSPVTGDTDLGVTGTTVTANLILETYPEKSNAITESNINKMVLNFWNSTEDQATIADGTSETFTPKSACIENTGTQTPPAMYYSLEEEGRYVPAWISIDSATGKITYTGQRSVSYYTFLFRATSSLDTSYVFDKTINLYFIEDAARSSGVSSGSSESGGSGVSDSTGLSFSFKDDKTVDWTLVFMFFLACINIILLIIVVVLLVMLKNRRGKNSTVLSYPLVPHNSTIGKINLNRIANNEDE